MKIGILVTGDTAVRAAHSLAAHPTVDEVVVIGPARSKSFQVVDTADECDVLVGHGPDAPRRARKHGIPLIWDGETPEDGVSVYGASPEGLTLALAERETDPRVVAVAHPDLEGGDDQKIRFPDPVGSLGSANTVYAGHSLAVAKASDHFAVCLAVGAERRVTVIDDAAFMSGIALAAGLAALNGEAAPVWDHALGYLNTAVEMGLVMGAA